MLALNTFLIQNKRTLEINIYMSFFYEHNLSMESEIAADNLFFVA